MSTLNPEQWRALAPYIDQALEMPVEEREAWLSSLAAENPALAAQLANLVEEHSRMDQAGFMTKSAAQGTDTSSNLAGQEVGPYTLISQIGQGGMGSVWLAERNDGRYQRKVAVKFLNIALAGHGHEDRFKREGRILGRLAHPHIAELVDAGVTHAGVPYLVLEYVEGDHIDRYCDQHRLDVNARLRLFLDVADAVHHAHVNLVVHRDLKPSNVLMSNDGQVKLLDFGIAKLLEGEGQEGAATALTLQAGRAMTPEYAAPEQVTGSAVTTATDVYALGVLLYVLLTGQHPAGGTRSPAELIKAIVDTEPPRPSAAVTSAKLEDSSVIARAAQRSLTPEKLHRVLRGDLDTIVVRALKKDPSERYASVTAFADDLARYLKQEPIRARPDTLAYRAAKFVRRNRTAAALAALAIFATIAGVVGTLIQARTARAQASIARSERDFALQQVSRTQAISEFMEFLLADAAPSGKPLQLNELLGRAENILAQQNSANDADHVNLLIAIGFQYSILDDDAQARKVLEQAYQLSQALSDPSVRAIASCSLASSLARGGENSQAEVLFHQGLLALPETAAFALDRNYCLLRGSEVARERAEGKEAVSRAEAALRVLTESPFRSDVREMNTTTDLAESYRIAGQNREAIPRFERAAALLSAQGRNQTQTAAVLFNNWGLSLYNAGRILEAEQALRRSIETSRTVAGEESVSPVILSNYAKTLRELGRLQEAAGYAERAYTRGRRLDHQMAINISLIERGRIYREQGNLALSEAMFAEVEPRLRKTLMPGSYVFAWLASDRALLALAGGQVPAALQLANQAVSIEEEAIRSKVRGSDYLPPILVHRANIELVGGQPVAAATDAGRALELTQGAGPGAVSSHIGRAYLALGRALLAQGQHEQARTALRSAANQLEKSLGPKHPDTRSAQQLASLDPPAQ